VRQRHRKASKKKPFTRFRFESFTRGLKASRGTGPHHPRALHLPSTTFSSRAIRPQLNYPTDSHREGGKRNTGRVAGLPDDRSRVVPRSPSPPSPSSVRREREGPFRRTLLSLPTPRANRDARSHRVPVHRETQVRPQSPESRGREKDSGGEERHHSTDYLVSLSPPFISRPNHGQLPESPEHHAKSRYGSLSYGRSQLKFILP
jgi:hypothetical protein